MRRLSRSELADAVEAGDRAKRWPVGDVGEVCDSSLCGLRKRRLPLATRVLFLFVFYLLASSLESIACDLYPVH